MGGNAHTPAAERGRAAAPFSLHLSWQLSVQLLRAHASSCPNPSAANRLAPPATTHSPHATPKPQGQFDRLANSNSGFVGVLDGAAAPSPAPGGGAAGAAAAAPQTCAGAAPAQVVIQALRPVPLPGQQPLVTLRNIGAQAANLTGARLSTPFSADALVIGERRECRDNATLAAGRLLVLAPRSDANPCGFPFLLNAT